MSVCHKFQKKKSTVYVFLFAPKVVFHSKELNIAYTCPPINIFSIRFQSAYKVSSMSLFFTIVRFLGLLIKGRPKRMNLFRRKEFTAMK